MLSVEQAMGLLYENYIDAELSHPGELDKWEGDTLFYCFYYDDGDNVIRYAYVNALTGEVEIVDEIEDYTGDERDDIYDYDHSGGVVAWWGTYVSSGYSVDIGKVDINSFYFEIKMLTTTQSTIVEEGWAEIDETGFFAVSGDMGFSLYDDFSAIDIFTSESSEWAELSGQYEHID